MKGKIFAHTDNLYQDQAQILFEYFRQKAEKVVTEEIRLEKLISDNEATSRSLCEESKKMNLYKTIGFALFFTIVGLVYGFIYMNKEKQLNVQIGEIQSRINEFKKLHKEIFRDYKVKKLGVAYIPVASQVAFENKSFIIDHTGSVPDEEFKLQIPRQEKLLTTQINELDELSKTAPIVENSEETEEISTDQYSRSIQKVTYHDYFGKLDRNLRTSNFCLGDMEVTSVSMPVIHPDNQYATDLKNYSTSNPENAPIISCFDTKKYKQDIEKFNTLNKLRNSLSQGTEQFEDTLRRLMTNMANSVQTVTAMKVASSNKLIEESNELLFKILKAPYNHYSPVLEATELNRIQEESFNYSESVENYIPFQLKQSSKVKYDIEANTWIAEDGSRTNTPFGITQIQEEIVAPIVQNLLQETRMERMRIYNDIKNQKIDYLNQWHRDTEDFYGRNRAESADLRNLMSANLRDFIAATNTLSSLEKTIKDMGKNQSMDATIVATTHNEAEIISAYEIQQKQFEAVQQQFDEYMDRLKEDITERAKVFEHIEYYDASLRDTNPKEISEATSNAYLLDERRKPLIAVNPLYAQNSEIPPQPNVEDLMYEHLSVDLNSFAANAMNELNPGVKPKSSTPLSKPSIQVLSDSEDDDADHYFEDTNITPSKSKDDTTKKVYTENAFTTIMKNRTDEQLLDFIQSPKGYKPEMIDAAKQELEFRTNRSAFTD